MFFLLFSEVFTKILNIYELPETYHKIPKYSQILVNNNHLPCQFYVTTSSDFGTISLLILWRICFGVKVLF